ncbi:hypothetical protein FQA39_LY04448 [Lamprigera yunnana]|nr:hypothetical protein FQA39_LY04448 [Lamprigera yunnana]
MYDASTSHNAQAPQRHVLSEDAHKNQLITTFYFVIFLCNLIGNVLDIVVQATGVSQSTVIYILTQGPAIECREKITFANATPTPKLSPKSSVDNCGEQVIRHIIHNIHITEKQKPTV